MKALKQNDYHYWDGYFKGLGVKELLEMPDSYWELLTSDLDMETFDIESNGECEDIQIKDMEFFKFSYM